MISQLNAETVVPDRDICIVGAGPVGIALALACEDAGLSVLLLESGLAADDVDKSALSDALIADLDRHASMTMASRRGLGGTSRWWGGRCVPYDDVDFSERPHIAASQWPVEHSALSAWYGPAAAFFGIDQRPFRAAPVMELDGASFETLERWTPIADSFAAHRQRLETSQSILVLIDATVVDLDLTGDGRVSGVVVTNGCHRRTTSVSRIVLACGGVETTRLLLNVRKKSPEAFGGPSGVLGHYYAGHISGKIADLVLSDPASIVAHDFFLENSAFARRRFTLSERTQRDHALLNTSFWIDNPPFHDWTHQNGVLSLVWLVLSQPWLGRRLLSEGVRVSHVGPRPFHYSRHIANALLRPFSTGWNAIKVIKGRLLDRPRKPGFLLYGRSGRYPLHYHAEQSPSQSSAVTLSDQADVLGMNRVRIDLRFSDQDVDSVIRSHAHLDRSLRQAGVGWLEYRFAPDDLAARVRDQATDGFHQTGTTRMGHDPRTSIVDADAAVHGMTNMFIASSSVFPTSGQANPTFLAVALALRLAEHLRLKSPAAKPSGALT